MINENSSEIRSVLMEMMGTHWIGVKFHKTKPRGMQLSSPESFCAAAARAITEPVLLKVSTIPCGGAKYAFNVPGAKAPSFGSFIPIRLNRVINPESAVSGVQRLAFSPAYISFNLPGSRADLYLSFMLLESANGLAQSWSVIAGKKLACKFTGVMSFCSEGAAGALNNKIPSLSLGCAKAIKTADLQGQVCVCLPENAAKKFVRAWRREPAMAGTGA
ncbi:MAG: hypothetical protein A2021_00675 [Elusimicrobia bacterium GWF2_52_66]|nr:MAG: hypothetical protein A2X33_00610 [Elusimicrobia bacterium GWA2_51_34]OGR86235.1 MAG: hypothetical protein A2021_00675 [Elusimicrobia bacterium GWF2_52_66]HAF96373.1 hypothetical protein [Elusimicrobiota bacterium]HCE98559.1 hypothetical protein [Elusimicrobiota bacterium]